MPQKLKLSTLCYIKKDGFTLMLNRNKKKGDVHKGKWNGLGGKFERGESPEECVTREVLEESGLTIKKPLLRGFLTFPNFKDAEDWYVYLYEATEFSGELIDCPEGELEWIKDTEVRNLPLWEGDYIFLDWLDKTQFFSGKFIYENKKLISHEVSFF